MHNYLNIEEVDIGEVTNSSEISDLYSKGFLFTRKSKGNLYKTRSLRIDLNKFELTSENRRILKKNPELNIRIEELPLKEYSWEIHLLAKNFYTIKFGDNTMTASKIKELFTDPINSNMNATYIYDTQEEKKIGYCPLYLNEELVHYAYPFYKLELEKDLGLGMMIKAITWAKENNKKYLYLGSVVGEKSKYKLQFNSLEWFDEISSEWKTNIDELKERIKEEESI